MGCPLLESCQPRASSLLLFFIFPLLTVLWVRMLFIQLAPCGSLGGADGGATRPPRVFGSGFPAWKCCRVSSRELQTHRARDVCWGCRVRGREAALRHGGKCQAARLSLPSWLAG